ncbi:MAG: hypothetical protein HY314_13000 [Acidobacteria bacterium]|nr:hypothetical protein [Acidobacteriota bacterium]
MEKTLATQMTGQVQSYVTGVSSTHTDQLTVATGPAGELSLARRLWEQWKRLGKKIGDGQARLLLILFYFLIFGPFALIVGRWTDPLCIKPGSPRGWQLRGPDQDTPFVRATRQF